jgi:hypothetical protein
MIASSLGETLLVKDSFVGQADLEMTGQWSYIDSAKTRQAGLMAVVYPNPLPHREERFQVAVNLSTAVCIDHRHSSPAAGIEERPLVGISMTLAPVVNLVQSDEWVVLEVKGNIPPPGVLAVIHACKVSECHPQPVQVSPQ